MDSDLIHILTQALEELGLEWSAPEDPACSRLDEWSLPGRHQQPSRQRLALFFPEVTKAWHAPYSRTSTLLLLLPEL